MKNQFGQIKQVSGYEYRQNCVLGAGSNAKVYAGRKKTNDMPIAVKVIKQQFITQKAMRYLFHCQIRAARELSHPNIVSFYDVIRERGMCYIFMEKCQAQNLRSLIKAKGFLSETEALEIFEGIVNGYLYLTKQKVLHRDLKPSNILFRSNGQPALADFGFCDFLDSPNRPTYYSVGSANYMAPQSYLNQEYSEKSDIWSLGVILYEMLTGHPLKTLSKKEQKHFKDLAKAKYPKMDLKFSLPLINNLLKGCLATETANRFSVFQIKEIIQKWRQQNKIEASFLKENMHEKLKEQAMPEQKLIKIESQKNILDQKRKQIPNYLMRKASQKTLAPKILLEHKPSNTTLTSSIKSLQSEKNF